MKSVCIVQARTTSTRLPGKVLLPLNGHTVIEEVLTRACRIKTDALVCAIPRGDVGLGEVVKRYCDVHYGSEGNVYSRFVNASEGYDIIMRLTADCPLLSPELCNHVLDNLGAADYVSNCEPPSFPKGFDCEVFTRKALLTVTNASMDVEHVTTHMRKGNFVRRTVRSPWPMDGRLTLDTIDDYRTILAAFADRERNPKVQKISDLPKAEPALDFKTVPSLLVGQLSERIVAVPQDRHVATSVMVAESQTCVWTGQRWAPIHTPDAILALEEKIKREILHVIAETH